MTFKYFFLAAAMVALAGGQAFCQMTILSGPEKGSYNQFVGDMVNVLGEKNNIKLKNQTTGGSAQNFITLTNPSSSDKMALIQSDYLNLMIAEDKLNNTNKTGSLRVVMPLAAEEIHLIAKKSSGFTNLTDLEKRKVGVGTKDQGSYATGKMIKERSKVEWYAYEVGFNDMLKKISSGYIEAGLIVGSAPVSMLDIDPQVMVDGISLLTLTDFNGWARFYENDTIHSSDYKWLNHDVPTFSVRTLLVVNDAKLTANDKRTVDAIKAGIAQNLGYLKANGHPKWNTVLMPDDVDMTAIASNAEPQATIVAAASASDNVVYRVQLYSRNYQKNNEQIAIGGKTHTAYVYSYKGAFRYTIGECATRNEAIELQKLCRSEGYPEAFVVAFKNNERSTDAALFK
jgi:uncharacterized protein